MKKILLFSVAAVILFAIPLSSLLSDFREINDQISLLTGQTAVRPVNSVQLASAQNYAGLPVGEVTLHQVPQAWGTAILIPQNHRYPGSEVDNPKNDSAELTQQQIYNIISFLKDQYGVNLIMAEGDLYGEVPREKIIALAQKIKSRDQLASQVEMLKEQLNRENISAEIKDNFLNHARQLIASLDREIYLQGAPYKLKAENQEVKLFGSENQATREQSADIVRNYIYQQDKLSQFSAQAGANGSSLAASGALQQLVSKFKQLKDNLLNRGQSTLSRLPAGTELNVAGADSLAERLQQFKDSLPGLSPATPNELLEQLNTYRKNKDLSRLIDLNGQTISDRLANLKNYLAQNGSGLTQNLSGQLSLIRQKLNPLGAFESDLDRLEAITEQQNKPALASILARIKNLFQQIKNNRQQPATAANPALPQRQDNPYAKIDNPAELQRLVADSEAKIQAVVINQRNQEAAQYFSQTLKEQNSTLGILQFGAGHEEGLIEQLNRQGLDVIVIKSDEVIRREKMSAVEKIL